MALATRKTLLSWQQNNGVQNEVLHVMCTQAVLALATKEGFARAERNHNSNNQRTER